MPAAPRLRPLKLALGLAVAFALLLPASALADSFAVDEVEIDATVAPTGDMEIVERRAMSFDGDFSRVYWVLDTKGSEGIEIVSVSDASQQYSPTGDPAGIEDRSRRVPGTYVVRETGGAVEVHVFHAGDAQQEFTLTYRVRGAATRWADTGELTWMLLGDGWAVPTDRFRARVVLPAGVTRDEVRAWAHGPLTGVVRIEDDASVTLAVDDVPANQFVEVATIFPADALSAAPIVDEPMLEEILAREAELANEANRTRRGARIQVALWTGVPWAFALGALGLGLWAFVRHGREFRPSFQGQYFREDPRPDLHPAVIGALWRFGRVEDVDIAATLMNLADVGAITMSPLTVDKQGLAGVFGGSQQTFVLQRVPAAEAGLSDLDRRLISILFDTVAGGRDQLALTELEVYAKANPQTFSETIKGWKEAASAQADSLGFFDPAGRAWQIGTFMVAAFVAVVGVFGAVQLGSLWPVLVPLPVAAVLAVLAIFMNRRSREGNELYRTYVAVRDFLRDFSRLEEAPPSSVILWNRFLVLAVVFGIAEQVIEQLRVKLPDVVADPGFQTSYWWVYAGSYGHSPVSSLSDSFVSATSIATSEMASASGGGGGFSGGGGFGGGGGGGGAD